MKVIAIALLIVMFLSCVKTINVKQLDAYAMKKNGISFECIKSADLISNGKETFYKVTYDPNCHKKVVDRN